MENSSNTYSKLKAFYLIMAKQAFLIIAILIFTQNYGFSQIRPAQAPQMPLPMASYGQNQVIINNTDSIVVITDNLTDKRRLIKNVSLQQNTTTLQCDLAILNMLTNTVEAFGHVKIIQADTVTITGDTAFYYGNTRQAKVTGKVTLNDNTIKLTTRRLDYDLNTHIAYYNKNGRIDDKKSILTSKEGYYDTVTKIFMFYHNVSIVDESSTVKTDSLRYSTLSKEAFFIAPTNIYTKTDTLLVKAGVYNTLTKISNFYGRSIARTQDYLLTADTLYYDTPTEIGILKGNAEMISKKDSVILTGNLGKYYGKQGLSIMCNKALMRAIDGRDTLLLTADTLVSFENKIDKIRKLYAYKNVTIFRNDLQGKCDSLSYNLADSTISFFQKPILWANGSQLEADSITLQLVNNKVRTIFLRTKSFVITEDSVKNYNQVKGRKITSYMDENSKINRVLVEGNGESIYYATGEKNAVIGMNRVDCSRMNINFVENKVKRIAFIGKPDASLTPPHEITPEKKELTGFKWRIKEKPTREATILGRITSDLNKPVKAIEKVEKIAIDKEKLPFTKKPMKKGNKRVKN